MAINLFLGKYQPSTQDTPLWEMYSDQFLHYHDMQSPHAPPRPDYIHWHVPVRRTSSTRRGHPLTPGTCLRLLRWRPPASRPCSHRPSPPSSHTTPLPLLPTPPLSPFVQGPPLRASARASPRPMFKRCRRSRAATAGSKRWRRTTRSPSRRRPHLASAPCRWPTTSRRS